MCNQNKTNFQINDYIIYGSIGVCCVKDICLLKIRDTDTTKKFYILQPLYAKGSTVTIYSPVDNPKTVMRRILTKEETQALITNIPLIEPICVDDTKKHEEQYEKSINTYDCYEWVRVIKSLYQRKEERVLQNKARSLIDERYLNAAEDLLFGELSVSLEIPKEQVENYIALQVHQQECM